MFQTNLGQGQSFAQKEEEPVQDRVQIKQMRLEQSKEISLINDPNLQDTVENVSSEYYQAYRALMNIVPPDPQVSARLFEKHGIKYRPEGIFHNFHHRITQNYLRHQIIMIEVSIAYFSLQVAVANDICSNPFARASSKEDNGCRSLHFYQKENASMAIKSFYYQPEEFACIFQRVLLEWSLLKICSALQCAPRLERFFGFDILVFKDCIQIAMQKCVGIGKMSLSWFETLKQQLEIMHSFHIVHLDIKPDNIAFSPGLKKPVFIDFGFSSVIREEVGFKKKSCFKGSAGFCSQEMLDLLGMNSQTYVDLYYNDLHCLQASLNNYSKEQPFHDEYSGATQYLEKFFSDLQMKQPERLFFTYNFKFYYVKTNVRRLSSLFDNKALLATQKQTIMKFMIDIFPHFFHSEVMEQLRQYSYTCQYEILMKRINLQKSKIRLYVEQQSPLKEDSQEANDYSSRYTHFFITGPSISTKEVTNFNVYHQFLLLRDDTALPKERCLDLLLQCLRFNIRNISFDSKKKLAAKWMKILTGKSQIEPSQRSINNIRSIFCFMLKYCNEQLLTEWKEDKYFEILFHSILFDINVLDNFQQFLAIIRQFKPRLIDKIVLKTYLAELEDRLHALNLADETNALVITFLVVLHKQIDDNNKQISKYRPHDYSQQEILALSIYNKLYQSRANEDKEQNFKIMQQKAKQVKNKRLRFYFSALIFESRLQFLAKVHATNKSLSLLKIREMTKDDIRHTINIHTLFQMSQMLFLHLELGQQFKRMTNQIKNIIGCSFIADKYNMDKYAFIVDNKNIDKALIIKHLTQLDRCYKQLQRLGLNVRRHLFYLLSKIQSLQGFDHDFKNLLENLYQKFKQTKDLISAMPQNKRVNFQQIYLNLDIQKLFIVLLPQLLQNFQSYIADVKEYTFSIDQKMLIKQCNKSTFFVQDMGKVCQYVKLKYQYFHSIYYYYCILKDKKKQLQYLLKLAKISQILDLGFINDHHCYYIILLSNQLKDKEIFTQFIHQQYFLALKNKSPIHYLLISKRDLFIFTLKYFYKIGDQQKIQTLLNMINTWINQNPLQQYMHHYIQTIHHFYLTNPTFFKLDVLKQRYIRKQSSNPYICILLVFCALQSKEHQEKIRLLRAISLMLDKLTIFGRGQELLMYHLVFANLHNISSRKVLTYFMRHNKYAFKGKPYSSLLKKRLKNAENCQKKKKLKNFLSKLR